MEFGDKRLRDHGYFVYMLASRKNGTIYIGVTSDLEKRLSQHRQGQAGSFTAKYNVFRLVWFEEHGDINIAIGREKALKEWRRSWKVRLIETENPEWNDLAIDWPI